MAVADLLHALVETTLATTGAVALVLLLRRPLRALFGAVVAYSAWWMVPLAGVAMLLPAAPAPVVASRAIQSFTAVAAAADAVAYQGGGHWGAWLLAAWSMGLVLVAIGLARQQRAFLRGLGTLRRRSDGLQVADAIAGLPAAIGWWRPAVVLPSDFETRYDALQRELLVAHERSHIAQGDLQANALVAVLRCIFWFNPMIHLATRHFRQDQELACDARIVARHPESRRAYGEAMLKTQLATQALPLSCHWGYGHPLKERIAMLGHPLPSFVRWLLGSAMVGALTLGCGFAAWANQATPGTADRTVSVRIDKAPLLVAAQEIAGKAGLRLANPDVLHSRQRFTFHLVDEPLDDVLSLLGNEVGLVPQVTDRDVRFVAAARSTLQRRKPPAPPVAPVPPAPPVVANVPLPPLPPMPPPMPSGHMAMRAEPTHVLPPLPPLAAPRPPRPPTDVPPDARVPPPPPSPPHALQEGAG